ncbi:septum formation inhibitor Maf [Antarcticibacterium sp. 1MA-6-2]|uniref:septum formation inhibitor Maf n=1 Tax=Antarcticibacterium sp. 1MA-6-2 TaxID=2908210 RepID=UPI001F340DE0|nr:septum formation inhibitor Maf [Antarcticibacterium sp. 1MA-6-2]UJH91517.1 septum formation inhibitor Maf [Antarcticibacterium sp. 1MA-6-2]
MLSCSKNSGGGEELPQRELSEEFKEYWFTGKAEISSYELEQSRYGETRKGNAVLIFVTEDFLKDEQVKANEKTTNTIEVLKLNSTKNFITGIYPYSIMQSSFYPLEGKSHALKVAASIQEWCGQVYMQLNNRGKYEIVSHSYFAGETDEDLSLHKVHLENEIWNQLRIDPDLLPTGEIIIIPSFEYIRLAHIEIKPHPATAEFYQDGKLSVYRITYPELKRSLKIYFKPTFPYTIEKWTEITNHDGNEYYTTANKLSTIKMDYWTKNSNKDLPLRDTLNLN